MNAPRIIPIDVLRRQREASDPALSAWVAANAGSGKTHVLAQRVIRLLLEGVDPAKLLCITFTKAAAANMANRVFDTLRAWTALDDRQLDEAIAVLSGLRPNADRRERARRLFALALETPGGLKVQTIHAFCARLLQQFPFEANVAARFAVLDDTAQSRLLDQTRLSVLLNAASAPESALGRALATAIASAPDQTFKEAVAEAIRKRDLVRAWIERGGIEAAVAELCRMLRVDPAETVEDIDLATVDGPHLPLAQWPSAIAVLDQGSARDQSQADALRSALAADGEESARLYRGVFLTGDGDPRKIIVTKAVRTLAPDLADALADEASRVAALFERRKAVACRDRTVALLTIANAVIARYQAEKDRRGLLDYDDLIDKTLHLLRDDRAAWVHYKLDRGIDHVLIDEAQDTSPPQWEIIRLLVGEFFAGEGARAITRTVFAVGDEKQSIFSFQGAAPREFEAMRSTFQRMCVAIESQFRTVHLEHSFRSGPNVLGAVDLVFMQEHIAASVTSDPGGITRHAALEDAAPGLVEIWDTIKPAERREIEAWDAPFDDATETSPLAQLAQKIARHVASWRQQGGRAGDVLILVRQRGPLFEGIIRALKDNAIPVAGADRLVLTEHIAVMDLMVLADAILLPDDDLALATVLKSPLFGLDDSDLFEIAWQREGSLRASLRANARFADIAARLDRYAQWARRHTPFDFFATLLGPEQGRKRFLARLGHEANDALDEFLNLALDYETRETASLQGFIAWLRTSQTDVKRDMEMTRDEVRVMTVHGAKGLEAPIVILADTTTPPAGPPQRQPRLLALPAAGMAPGTPDRFVWAGVKATDFGLVSEARERARREAGHEYRRLLYVAMTRAIDRLIICGVDGERRRPDGCWYDLVRGALEAECVSEPADDGDGEVLRYRKVPLTGGARISPVEPAPATIVHPAWLDRPAPADLPAIVPVSPSSAYDEATQIRVAAPGSERAAALLRGDVVHRLLRALPDLPPETRAEAARRHLARAARELPPEDCDAIAAQVLGIIDDPRFHALFAPGSRAEVPIVGRIARPDRPALAVAGQVDRLVVTPEAVLIADYKTNRPAPRRLEDARAYVTQLALYRAVIAALYPDRPVRAALIWTDVPDLMEVSAEAMDAALAAVTSP